MLQFLLHVDLSELAGKVGITSQQARVLHVVRLDEATLITVTRRSKANLSTRVLEAALRVKRAPAAGISLNVCIVYEVAVST